VFEDAKPDLMRAFGSRAFGGFAETRRCEELPTWDLKSIQGASQEQKPSLNVVGE